MSRNTSHTIDSVMLPLSYDMSEWDMVILIDRVERMFWFMHGQSLADPLPERKEAT